jgi:radical SAM superfamily enzyme YgiQ (UPF0313 family)
MTCANVPLELKGKTMKIAFIFPPPWDPTYPSYSMALFKASTKKYGHDFLGFDLNVDLFNAAQDGDKKLWDAQHANLWDVDRIEIIQKYTDYLDSYVEKIIINKIDLFAISIISYGKHLAFDIAKRIKNRIPKAVILFGGPQCFPAYDGLTVLDNKYVDAICTGEGDVIWPEVLEHFNKVRNLQVDIPGLSYKKNDGTIIDNGVPELVKDLNSIPFADYSDIDFAKYSNKYSFSIMTSRGCINTCAFCSERPNFHRYRFRSAENVFDEIATHLHRFKINPAMNLDKETIPFKQYIFNKISKYTTRLVGLMKECKGSPNIFTPYISFNDSLINGVPKELEKFCDLVIDSDLRFLWGGMALIRKEMTYDLLVKMKKAGCFNLSWGMESGCQEVLDLMHKKFINMDIAKEVIKLAHKADIKQSISLIVGFPGETDEMFLETTKFLSEFKDYFVSVTAQPMMIVNNSLVSDKPEKFGVECLDDRIRWHTTDGTNNYDIRLKRVEIINSLLDGHLIKIDK